MSYKIKKQNAINFILAILLVVTCVQMSYLTAEHNAMKIYKFLQIGLLGMGLFLAIPKYKRFFLDTKNQLILLYCFIYLFSSLYNHNSVETVVFFVVRILCVALIVEIGKGTYSRALIAGIMYSLIGMTIVNTIISIVYPNALYANNVGRYVCFLLGEDNASINLYLLTVCVTSIYTYLNKQKMSVWLVISIANVSFFSMTRNIAGGIVCSAVLLILYLLLWFKDLKIRMRHVLIGMAIFFVLFILLQRFSLFENIITYYLHRDLTLTSRTSLWNQALMLFKEKPLIGYGSYYNSSLADVLYGARGIRTVLTPHNTYLANLIAGGILLFGTFILMLLDLMVRFDNDVLIDDKLGQYRSVISIAWLVMMLHGQIEGSDSEVMLIAILLISMVIQENLKPEKRKKRKRDTLSRTRVLYR